VREEWLVFFGMTQNQTFWIQDFDFFFLKKIPKFAFSILLALYHLHPHVSDINTLFLLVNPSSWRDNISYIVFFHFCKLLQIWPGFLKSNSDRFLHRQRYRNHYIYLNYTIPRLIVTIERHLYLISPFPSFSLFFVELAEFLINFSKFNYSPNFPQIIVQN